MPEETTVEQRLARVEAKLALPSLDQALDQRLAKVEASISLILKITAFAVPAFLAALVVIYWYLIGISEKIGRLDARVDGYQNEALLKTLNEIKTSGTMTPAAQEAKQTIEKIAAETMQRELERRPVNANVYFELGMFAASNGNLKQAAEYFEKAAVLNPFDFKSWSSAAGVYLLMADREPKNQLYHAKMARQAADKALSINPNHSNAHTNRGIALFILGEKDHAVEAEIKSINLDPKSPSPYYNLACFYATDSWNNGKALDYLQLAVDRGFEKIRQLRADENKCFKSIRRQQRFQDMAAMVARRTQAPHLP